MSSSMLKPTSVSPHGLNRERHRRHHRNFGNLVENWKQNQWCGRTDLTPQPVPPDLDYDLWLGPAPKKPYHPHRVHATFRGYWDYDGGGLGDMGQHYLDPVQYLLEKDNERPIQIEADTG